MATSTNQGNFQDFVKSVINFTINSMKGTQTQQNREVSRSAVNIANRPLSNKLGVFKLLAVWSVSLWFGGLLAHKGASYFEENNIFVPVEDDDDDD